MPAGLCYAIEKDEVYTFFKELAKEDDVREAEKKKRQAAKYHESKTPVTLVGKEPTEAEKKLKEEAEKAKTKLLEEIKSFKTEDQEQEVNTEEEEDPRVKKFTVTNPVKVGGNVKYTVTGVDDEGEFSEVRRFREFHALG